MAYSEANSPALTSQRVGADGGANWTYKSADALATVVGAGYFSNGSDLGMVVGDRVTIVDTTTPLVTDAWVSAVTAGGAATVTADA
jgi:hypothetical protein